MPCRQVSTYNGTAATSGSYRTEADCLQACQEGACCEGTTCSVKPQCQCQSAEKVFKGVGTVCSPNPCDCCKSPKVWQAIYYIACTDQPFGPCLPATDADCGCNTIASFTGGFFSTYLSWTTSGRKGISCVSGRSGCGTYDSLEQCKAAASAIVGGSVGVPVSCKGVSYTMPWGRGPDYNPGTDPNYYGYGSMYDCVQCDASCKPCSGGTAASKATVTAVVDGVASYGNSSFSAAELKSFFEGTYVLNKTNIGSDSLVGYTFGGWPVQVGPRYADMIYDCRTSGSAFTGSGTT